jgi:hypothetical protein
MKLQSFRRSIAIQDTEFSDHSVVPTTLVRASAMLLLIIIGIWKYDIGVASSRIVVVPRFVKIGQPVQKLKYTHT